MRAFVLGSGSSGNALLVEAGGARVLVDAGVGPRQAATRLAALGGSLLPRGVDAIVATHQHGDHLGQIEKLARALGAPVYLHRGIEARRVRKRFDVRDYEPGTTLRVGALEIEAVPVPHDAPQVALRIAADGRALGVATDVGHATAPLAALLARCDAAIVEANHCPEMLASGPYPWRLKARVGGALGHLSNAQCAALAARLVGSRLSRIWLGHLSRSNNTPERALETVAEAARGIAVEVLPHGAVCAFEVRGSPAVQLALPFGGLQPEAGHDL